MRVHAQMDRQVPLVITPSTDNQERQSSPLNGAQAQMEHEQRELGQMLATIGQG